MKCLKKGGALSQLLRKLQALLCSDPTLQGGTLPAQEKSKFISFHALRCYWLHIVLMWCIITETALKICIFYLCFIVPRIFPDSFFFYMNQLKIYFGVLFVILKLNSQFLL